MRIIWAIVGLFWVAAIGAGLCALWRYSGTPGPAAHPLHKAMVDAPLSADRPTLLLFAHPYCPCTQASLETLEQLLAAQPVRDRVAVRVVFTLAPGLRADAGSSRNWQRAGAMEYVRVVGDPGGALARRFGARTSGQVYLYSPQGELLFSGGITPGRGQGGESAGGQAVAALLSGRPPTQNRTSVYGCSLMGEASNP